jgi:hypothetical protein
LRILLDENVDRRLKGDFAEGHDVSTVAEAGWAGKKNGELLGLAEREFDVLVSSDKGILHQQNVSRLDLAVGRPAAPRSNALEDLVSLMDQVNATLGSIEPGSVARIPSG